MTAGIVDTSAGTLVCEPVPGGRAVTQPPGGWGLNNVGLIELDGTVVVVDTMATQQRNERLRDLVLDVARGRQVVTVNTHFHGDHTFGNSVLATLGPVIASQGTARTTALAGADMCGIWPEASWGELRIHPATLRMTGSMSIVDGREIVLDEVENAHTGSDVTVWDARHRVLYAGDLVMSSVTPFVLMGSLRGTVRAVRRLAGLRPVTVVPGHGPVAGPAVLDENLDYLDWCWTLAQRCVREGLSPLAAARAADLGRFRDWLDPERLVGNLHAGIADITGRPVDLAAAMAQLREFSPDALHSDL